jgi:formylglycine-generating enzyme required for sulfatase activity
MANERDLPGEYDAVLGGQNLIPCDAAVLGGIAGVKSRLASPDVEVRIAALSDAFKYGDAGLDLIIGALHDESIQVKFTIYSMLKHRNEEKIKQHLQNYFFTFDVITVDSYGQESNRYKSFACYFPEDLGNSIMLEMVYIPGGTFMMGSFSDTDIERFYYTEMLGHQVTVSAFYAGKYPITQAQWQAVMGNNPSHFQGEKRPVECVSWDDAVEFCSKLSEKTGRKYRLLSEAEWEYACRAGTTTPFHFGETITPDLVNYDGNKPYANAPKGLYRRQTTDVGIFPPNAFGLYDMHGNVWEWCSDVFYNSYGFGGRAQRGGSWIYEAVYCRSAYRVGYPAYGGWKYRGFRIAVTSVSSSS